MLIAFILFPLERSLYFLKRFRGFRKLDDIFIRKILNSHRVVFFCKVNDKTILLVSNPNDDLFDLIRNKKLDTWEPGSLATWSQICSQSQAVVDIGGYSGIYSLIASKHGVDKIWTFEPNPFSAERLQINSKINHANNIRIVNAALSENTGKIIGLFVPPNSFEKSGNRLESSGARFLDVEQSATHMDGQEWTRVAEAETFSLDDFFASNLVTQKIGGIKIDAEGMELSILRGAKNILKTHGPELIIETWSESSTKELNELLSKYGYSEGELINDKNYNVAASNLHFIRLN
jgi:FkbM family methyltransferase